MDDSAIAGGLMDLFFATSSTGTGTGTDFVLPKTVEDTDPDGRVEEIVVDIERGTFELLARLEVGERLLRSVRKARKGRKVSHVGEAGVFTSGGGLRRIVEVLAEPICGELTGRFMCDEVVGGEFLEHHELAKSREQYIDHSHVRLDSFSSAGRAALRDGRGKGAVEKNDQPREVDFEYISRTIGEEMRYSTICCASRSGVN